MKFGKKELKDMILNELNDLVSSQDDPTRVTNDFETFAFTNHINAILGNVKQMEKVIREDEGLDRKTLISFKEKELEDLHMAISFVGDAIDARLKEQNADL
tara:strand:+ start:14694 stop:14996 length:303 start_codon:yes stop_codon:yes gene_type:complete